MADGLNGRAPCAFRFSAFLWLEVCYEDGCGGIKVKFGLVLRPSPDRFLCPDGRQRPGQR